MVHAKFVVGTERGLPLHRRLVSHMCPLLKARLTVIAPHGQRFFRERGRPAPGRKVAEGKARIENVAGFFGLAV